MGRIGKEKGNIIHYRDKRGNGSIYGASWKGAVWNILGDVMERLCVVSQQVSWKVSFGCHGKGSLPARAPPPGIPAPSESKSFSALSELRGNGRVP